MVIIVIIIIILHTCIMMISFLFPLSLCCAVPCACASLSLQKRVWNYCLDKSFSELSAAIATPCGLRRAEGWNIHNRENRFRLLPLFIQIYDLRNILFDFQNNDKLRENERAKISQFSSIQHIHKILYTNNSLHTAFPSLPLLSSCKSTSLSVVIH